jgi:hypothetical protein
METVFTMTDDSEFDDDGFEETFAELLTGMEMESLTP